jgi:hypothetical protein
VKKLLAAAIPLLSGCVSLQMQAPPAVTTIDFANGNDFIVALPYRYRIGQSAETIPVPAGFVTDYASIPISLQWLVPKLGRHNRAAVIHDYLYWSQTCTKAQADNLLMIAMKELGVKKGRRRLIYEAVHLRGRPAWEANRRELAAGWPKIVPQSRYALADTLSWREARTLLRSEGVRDPQFPASASFCAIGNSQEVPKSPLSASAHAPPG